MASISQIRTAIKTKLDGLATPAIVYDIFRINVAGYPAVMFEPTELANEILDTCNNLRTYKFAIGITQEIERIDRDGWMDILIGVFDEIVSAFDDDYTLGGLCEGGVLPMNWRFGVAEMENWNILFVDFVLECKTTYQLS